MKVGDRVLVERRTWSGTLVHSYEVQIARITPKRAYLGPRPYFRLDDPRRVVLPRYLDYETRVARIVDPEPEENGRG